MRMSLSKTLCQERIANWATRTGCQRSRQYARARLLRVRTEIPSRQRGRDEPRCLATPTLPLRASSSAPLSIFSMAEHDRSILCLLPHAATAVAAPVGVRLARVESLRDGAQN